MLALAAERAMERVLGIAAAALFISVLRLDASQAKPRTCCRGEAFRPQGYRLFDLASQRDRHKRNVRPPYQGIESMIHMIATIVPIFSRFSPIPFLHVGFSG